MNKKVNYGGQTRRLICGCGYNISASGDPGRNTLRWKLHCKKCEFQDNEFNCPPTPFNKEQSIQNGVTKWNKGRVIHFSKKDLKTEKLVSTEVKFVKGYNTDEIIKQVSKKQIGKKN